MLKSDLARNSVWIRCVAAILLLSGVMAGSAGASGDSIDLEIREDYENGSGNAIGVIEQTKGDSFIQHSGDHFGYRCVSELPVFTGDALITGEGGKIRVKLSDESQLTLSPESKIILNRALYNPENRERESFFSSIMGKTRFLIKKMTGFKKSDVKVKTKTAVLGVRGSDFVVASSGDVTEITTFENTIVDVAAVNNPEVMITLREFERVQVDVEGVISEVERLIREDINRIRREFIISARTAEVSIPKLDRNIRVPEETLVDPDQFDISDPDSGLIRRPAIRTEFTPDERSKPDIGRIVETQREGTLPERMFDWPDKPDRQ